MEAQATKRRLRYLADSVLAVGIAAPDQRSHSGNEHVGGEVRLCARYPEFDRSAVG
jgi:hypothetical protein